MPEVTEDLYLGDILSCNGKNTKNVRNRITKVLGIINHIFKMLENITVGSHFFKIALLLRDSMLINGSLSLFRPGGGGRFRPLVDFSKFLQILYQEHFPRFGGLGEDGRQQDPLFLLCYAVKLLPHPGF